MESITSLIELAGRGEETALRRLFQRVYNELKLLARKERRRIAANTLNTTGLVHEAYLKLAGAEKFEPDSRHHFFALAAKAMRQIVIDHARASVCDKRGGAGLAIVDLDAAVDVRDGACDPETLLRLHEALARFEVDDPRLVQLVELRFFAGLPLEEIAELLQASERTLNRDWRRARAQLFAALYPDGSDEAPVSTLSPAMADSRI